MPQAPAIHSGHEGLFYFRVRVRLKVAPGLINQIKSFPLISRFYMDTQKSHIASNIGLINLWINFQVMHNMTDSRLNYTMNRLAIARVSVSVRGSSKASLMASAPAVVIVVTSTPPCITFPSPL